MIAHPGRRGKTRRLWDMEGSRVSVLQGKDMNEASSRDKPKKMEPRKVSVVGRVVNSSEEKCSTKGRTFGDGGGGGVEPESKSLSRSNRSSSSDNGRGCRRLARFVLLFGGAATMVLLLVRSEQLRTNGSGPWMVPGPMVISSSNASAQASRSEVPAPPLQPIYEKNRFLAVSANGGLNQMRTGICDMVAIAKYLNATLIIPELDHNSFWNDSSEFKDIFDVDHFIASLSNEVHILKELPPEHQRRVASRGHSTMTPASWSDLSYYINMVLPKITKYKVVHFARTDARLANNGLPIELQRLRCQANYEALKFTPAIQELGKKIVRLLREKGSFLALHLRYEIDVVAFSGCTEGCTHAEVLELAKLRYAIPWWGTKEINSRRKRRLGSCPLTPEETALALQAFGIDNTTQIYIAAGETYGGERRMATLAAAYPNLIRKEMLLEPSDLIPVKNHSNQMAALDYYVSLESDIFVPTYAGNMEKALEGHRRFLGFKPTIVMDRKLLVNLMDQYKNGTLSWYEFTMSVRRGHAKRLGNPVRRLEIPGEPKEEDYFYSNPQECLPTVAGPPKTL